MLFFSRLGKTSDLLKLRLKAEMAGRGMDYNALAAASGLTRSGVYKIVEGHRWPSPDNLDRIANGLSKKGLSIQPWELIRPEEPAELRAVEVPGLRPLVKELEKLTQGDAAQIVNLAWEIFEMKTGKVRPDSVKSPREDAQKKKG